MPRPRVLAPWLVLFLAPACLLAEDPDPMPIRFGVQITGASPRQDFADISRKAGAGFGFFLESDQGDGWSCRSRVDYLAFGSSTVKDSVASQTLLPERAQKATSNFFSIGAEVRYHVKVFPKLVLLGGIFGGRMEFESTGPTGAVDANGTPIPGTFSIKDRTSFKLGYAGGLGFAIIPDLTLTVRYATTNLDGITLGTLEGGLDYRF